MATIPPPVQKQKESWGCWGCGCGLVLLAFVALFGLGIYGIYATVRNLTDTTSAEVPQYDGGDAVYKTASQKVSDFQKALEQAKPATLHLNSDEINTLIEHDPAYAKLRGHLFVKLDGEHADVQASFPVSMIETKIFADRFLNASATIAVSFDPGDKTLNLDLRQMSIKGTSIPASTVASFNQSFNTTINSKLQANPGAHDFLNRAQKITIEDGQLVIETK